MDQKELEEVRKKNEKNLLDLFHLHKKNRFMFEQKSKQLIKEEIENSPGNREKLRKTQDNWDRIMKGAGSEYNRFVLAQSIFCKHIFENR